MSDALTALSMTRDFKIFRRSPWPGPDGALRYSLAKTFQISPTRAVALLGTEVIGGRALDYVGGVEALVFDRLDDLDPKNAFPLIQNEFRDNPLNGEPCLIMKFFPALGFVPLGAAHPAAGTGFGLSYWQSMPLDMSDKEAFSGSWASRDDIYRAWELLQFRYDGERFEIVDRELFSHLDLLPGRALLNRALSVAVPDGDDLLLPVQVSADRDPRQMCGFAEAPSGVSRWRRGASGWRPVSYVDVTGDITAFEPSMVRDMDGSLLFTARQTGRDILEKFDIFLWRSTDNGESWELAFRAPKTRAASPVTLNLSANGKPFIAGNLMTAALNGASNYGYSREILALWELAEDRKSLKSPALPRCARTEFGPPPSAAGWRIDHPLSGVVRLADGRPRALLSYRVMGVGEGADTLGMTARTGCYIEEVLDD